MHVPSLIRRVSIIIALLVLAGCTPAESVFVPVQAVQQPVQQPGVAETSAPAATAAPTITSAPAVTATAVPPVVEPTSSAGEPVDGQPLRGPLSVTIDSPQDNAELTDTQVTLSGEADPDTVISIDDQIVVTGPDRKFSVPLTLEEGPNVIEITASDAAGNQGTVFMTLYVN